MSREKGLGPNPSQKSAEPPPRRKIVPKSLHIVTIYDSRNSSTIASLRVASRITR